MTLNETKRVALLIVATSAALGLASTGLASAAPSVGGHATATHHPAPHKKAPRPKPGVFVTGESRVTATTRASAYLDRGGQEHFIALVPNANHAGMDSVDYYNRAIGAKKWTVHAAPTLIPSAGSPRVEEDYNWQSDDIDVVVYACNGIYAGSATTTATRLPEFTLVQSAQNCSSPATAATSYKQLSGYYENADSNLVVIAPDQTVGGAWNLLTGSPGGSFTSLLALPTADSFVPTQLGVGPNDDNDLTIVGYGVDSSGDKGVFEARLTWTYNSTGQGMPGWTDLKEIATLGETGADYVIDSIAEFDGTTDVGMYKPSGTSPGQKHTLFIDEGDYTNQWSSPIALEHTTVNDRDLLLARNPITGTLHAIWERAVNSSHAAKTAKSGILQERITTSDPEWTKPLFLTHWYKDKPLQLSVDFNGTTHVEYQQS